MGHKAKYLVLLPNSMAKCYCEKGARYACGYCTGEDEYIERAERAIVWAEKRRLGDA